SYRQPEPSLATSDSTLLRRVSQGFPSFPVKNLAAKTGSRAIAHCLNVSPRPARDRATCSPSEQRVEVSIFHQYLPAFTPRRKKLTRHKRRCFHFCAH